MSVASCNIYMLKIWLLALSAFSTRLKQSSGLDDLSAPGVWVTCGLTIFKRSSLKSVLNEKYLKRDYSK